MVGMRREGCFRKLFEQPAERTAVGAHAAFFDDDIALLVELAHHRMQKALGFEIGPELEAIFWKRVVIVGLIVTGGGVHVLAAILFDDLAEGILDHVLVGLGNGVFPCFFQVLQFRFVATDGLVALVKVGP